MAVFVSQNARRDLTRVDSLGPAMKDDARWATGAVRAARIRWTAWPGVCQAGCVQASNQPLKHVEIGV